MLDKITTTIRREPMADIIARRKVIEYREIKPYWEKRLSKISVPFVLRLINGMALKAPEVTVQIKRVRRDRRTGTFELHIGRVLETRYWGTLQETERNVR